MRFPRPRGEGRQRENEDKVMKESEKRRTDDTGKSRGKKEREKGNAGRWEEGTEKGRKETLRDRMEK